MVNFVVYPLTTKLTIFDYYIYSSVVDFHRNNAFTNSNKFSNRKCLYSYLYRAVPINEGVLYLLNLLPSLCK